LDFMDIRYAVPQDATLLAEIGARTFYDTYIKFLDAKALRNYVNVAFTPENQLDEITDPDTIFLIAEERSNKAGYAMLKFHSIASEESVKKSIEISRIYLLNKYIGRGIGAELMTRSINEARASGCENIWLGVWEKNIKAIRFYEKWGFEMVGSRAFIFGNESHNDLIMKLHLKTTRGYKY